MGQLGFPALILHVLTKKMHTHTWCFHSQNNKVMGVWSSEVKCIKWIEKLEIIQKPYSENIVTDII